MTSLPSNVIEITLPLIGLDCDGCVNTLTNALMKSEAIISVTITLTEAFISYDSAHITKDDIIRLIEKAGFDVGA